MRNDRGLKLQHLLTDMASLWLSLQKEDPLITKVAMKALLPFSTSFLCYEPDEEQEEIKASHPGGGLEGMPVNHPPSNKGHNETSPSTDFSLIFFKK